MFALGRVYRNLITNAIQATQAGGRVTIGTARDRDHVEVSVTDTGSGIPSERLVTHALVRLRIPRCLSFGFSDPCDAITIPT